MRGLENDNKNLSALLRSAREAKGVAIESAWRVLNLSSREHLYKAETGRLGISAKPLLRAMELYSLKKQEVIEAAVADFQASLKRLLK